MKRNLRFVFSVKKIFFAALISFCFLCGIFPSEKKVSISFINDAEKISLASGKSSAADAIIGDIKNLSPNYLAEITYEVPFAGNENLPEFVYTLFCDMNLFLQIPYYSERSKVTVPLFSKAEMKSSEENAGGKTIRAVFCMTPFSDYNAKLKISVTENSFLFQHDNLDKMNFAGLAAIGKETMKAGIAVYRDGDSWKIFALGGVKSVKPPFLKKRLETAFNNRIKDFCVFYISKLDEYCGRDGK